MRPLNRARPLAVGLLAAGMVACSCSGRDVSLGEDLHRTPPPPVPTPTVTPTPAPAPVPVPIPIPTPDPDPDPDPTPTPTYPCESQFRGTCLVPTAHCDGRFTTQPGHECGPGTICCERVVGTGRGGASGVEPGPAGAGGQ